MVMYDISVSFLFLSSGTEKKNFYTRLGGGGGGEE